MMRMILRRFAFRPAFLLSFSLIAGVAALLSAILPVPLRAASLGTTNLVVGPVAGTNSVVLADDGAWSASTSAGWLHLSADNLAGTGSTNLVFSYDANPGPTRSGTLAIGGLTLTVIQAGASYVAVSTPVTIVSSGLLSPTAVALDSQGNVYFTDTEYNVVYKWLADGADSSTGTNAVTTLVTSGLSNPIGLAVDGTGTVYIADPGNMAVYAWHPGDPQTLPTAIFSSPSHQPNGVAVDGNGVLYIADGGSSTPAGEVFNQGIRVLDGLPGSTNYSTLVSAGLTEPFGVAVDVAGNVYTSDSLASPASVDVWRPGSPSANSLFSTSRPWGVAVDGSGKVYSTGQLADAVWVWEPASPSRASLFLVGADGYGGGQGGGEVYGIAVDGAGNVYFSDTGDNTIKVLPNAFVDPTPRSESGGDGGGALPPVVPASIRLTGAMRPTSDQPWLTIVDAANGVVSYRFGANFGTASRTAHVNVLGQSIAITQEAAMVSFALGRTTALEDPGSGSDSVVLKASHTGAPWVASTTNSWLHLDAANQSGLGSATVMFSYDANDGSTRRGTITIAGLTLDVTQAGASYVRARPFTTLTTNGLAFPSGVAVDSVGNVYVADTDDHAIKEWQKTSGAVTTLTTTVGATYGVAVDGVGNVYFSDSGTRAPDGTNWTSAPRISKLPAGSTNATTLVSLTARRANPQGVAVDSVGNVYFTDAGDQAADYVLKQWQAASQTVVTLGSGLSLPSGLAVDAAGNVYVVIPGAGTVLKWTQGGSSFSALVPNLGSTQHEPHGVAVDGAGVVYFADSQNNAVKVWRPVNPYASYLETTNQGLNLPHGVAVDASGNVYIADSSNKAIKEVPWAFVDRTPKSEPNMAGSDVLPAVLPTSANLGGPFEPTADQPWLTVTGVTNGVVSYSFTENTTGGDRTGSITVLGQAVAITQTGLPRVATRAATDVGPFAATLNATVNPVGADTDTWFEYGITTHYGNSTATSTLSAGTTDVSTPMAVSGLVEGMTYHFRAVARNGSGTNAGADLTFTTQAAAVTLGASSLLVGPSAGRSGVVLVGGGSWPNTANVPWLHFDLDHTPGTGNTNVLFNHDPNPNPGPRTGTLSIGDQTITVTQAGAGSVPAGAVMLFQSAVAPGALAANASGDLLFSGADGDRIWGRSADGEQRLVSSGYGDLKFIAGDAAANVYFYDYGSMSLGEWSAGGGKSQVWSGIGCAGPALDPFGNLYFIDTVARQIHGRNASGSALALLGTYASGNPFALAADAAGNLYFTDTEANSIQRLTSGSYTGGAVIPGPALKPNGSSSLWGLAVNGSGNVYYGGGQAIWEWSAANQTSSLRIAASNNVFGVTVDGEGNVYYSTDVPSYADPGILSMVFEMPRAWVSQPSSGVLPMVGGGGSLQVVPSTFNLTGLWAPGSDQAWLAITNIENGVLSYTINTNTSGAARVAHINLLGTSLSITQTSRPLVYNETATRTGFDATLGARLDPEGAATTYWFEYGSGTGYGSSTTSNSVPADTGNTAVHKLITGLTLGATYHYRIVATNSDGITTGGDSTFTMPSSILPVVSTQPATGIDQSQATLNATVNPGGLETTYYFQYGPTNPYGIRMSSSGTLAAGQTDVSITKQLTGLSPGQVYHFRIVASNSLGTSQGSEVLFTNTPAAVAASNLLVDSAAGSDSVTVAIGGVRTTARAGLQGAPGGTWTAWTTASWLHLSPENQEGVGSTNVVFTFDANPGPTRSDTLTIAGETITVTQAGATYVAAGKLIPLVSSGLSSPSGIEVDREGNLYIADTGGNALRKWQFSSHSVETLVSNGLSAPTGVAVDVAGNVYIADRDNSMVKQWRADSQSVTNLLSVGLNAPHDVAVDHDGNVFIADFATATIKQLDAGSQAANTLVGAELGLEGPTGVDLDAAGIVYLTDTNRSILAWNPASRTLSTLVPSLAVAPRSVAVDTSGNVYFPDHANAGIMMWSAANRSVTTLVAEGLTAPSGVAVDGARNLYVSDTATGLIHELPHAFVDPTPRILPGLKGVGVLPGVLPDSASLSGPFTPASDQPWLTITGATNGVVGFFYSENNSGGDRLAHISLLGHRIPVTQLALPLIRPAIRLIGGPGGGVLPGTPGGSFGFEFTGAPGGSYAVLTTPDAALPLDRWLDLGAAEEHPAGSGNFHFLDAQAADAARYYILIRR